jgi:hypothetical protein
MRYYGKHKQDESIGMNEHEVPSDEALQAHFDLDPGLPAQSYDDETEAAAREHVRLQQIKDLEHAYGRHGQSPDMEGASIQSSQETRHESDGRLEAAQGAVHAATTEHRSDEPLTREGTGAAGMMQREAPVFDRVNERPIPDADVTLTAGSNTSSANVPRAFTPAHAKQRFSLIGTVRRALSGRGRHTS